MLEATIKELIIELLVPKVDLPREEPVDPIVLQQVLEPKSIVKKVEEEKPDTIEKEVEDVEVEEEEPTPVVELDYSFDEEQRMFAKLYEGAQLDYGQLFYGGHPPSAEFAPEDDYWVVEASTADTEQGIITTEEAEQTFKEIQYAAATAQHFSVNFDDKRKLDFWIKFNPAYFALFETLHTTTRDVNYAPPGWS